MRSLRVSRSDPQWKRPTSQRLTTDVITVKEETHLDKQPSMSSDENKPEQPPEDAPSTQHQPVRESESLTNVFSELRAKRPADEPEPFRISPRAIAISAGVLLAFAALWAVASVNWVSERTETTPMQSAGESQSDEQSATDGSGNQAERDVGEEGTGPSGSERANATGSPSDPWMPSGNGTGSEMALPSRDGTDSEIAESAAGSAAGSASEPAEPPARTLPALLGFVLLIMVFEILRFAIGRERSRWLPQFDLGVSILFVALLAFALVALTSILTADNHQPAASPVSAANPSVLPASQLPPPAPVPPPQPPSSEHAESTHGDAQEERAPATISDFVDSLDSSATDFAQLAEALRPPETASIAEFVASLEAPEDPGQFEQLAAQLNNPDSGSPPADPASELPGTELDQPETDEEPGAQNGGGNDEPQQEAGIPDEDDESANSTEEVQTDVEEPSWAGYGCHRPRRGGIWDAYILQCLAREFGLSQDDEEPSGEAVEQPGEEAVEWPSEEANARTGEEAVEWPSEEADERPSGEAAGRPSGEAAEQPSGDPWPDSSIPPSEQAGAATEAAAEEAQDAPAADQSEPEAPETNNDPAVDPSAVAPLDEPSAPAPEQPAPSPPPPFAIGLILGGLLEGLAAVARVTWQYLQKSENDES